MAHDSSPPVFDMSYRPERRMSFGPPRWTWIAPVAFLVFAAGFAITVQLSRLAHPGSWWFSYFVEQDVPRVLSVGTFSLILLGSAFAAVLRTSMRGVRVFPDGIEARGTIVMGWPRIRACEWVEIDHLMLRDGHICLCLWDGSSIWLPDVAESEELAATLRRIARLRAIPVSGEASTQVALLARPGLEV